MNRVLNITYDLRNPGQNYEMLLQRIKKYPSWARLGGSSYLIFTDNSPQQVRDYLLPVLDNNDQLWVGVAPAPSAWHELPDDVANWIHENQK